MRKYGLFIFALALFAFVSTSYAGIGVDSDSYVINVSKTPVVQEGVVNVPVKALLGKIVNEGLDKSKTIQVIGADEEANLLKEISSLYGYNLIVVQSNAKNVAFSLDVADMPISSFLIPDELSSNTITLEKVLNAFYEVEKSGYQVDVLTNAVNLLTEFLSLLTVPVDIIQSLVNAVSAGETVSTFVSTIIDLLGSIFSNTANIARAPASKDVQYMETLDLIMHPIGQGLIVPMLNAVDAVVAPMLPGGTMPAAATRMIMQVMFPALDFVFDSLPFLRPVAMDLMAPITANMH